MLRPKKNRANKNISRSVIYADKSVIFIRGLDNSPALQMIYKTCIYIARVHLQMSDRDFARLFAL